MTTKVTDNMTLGVASLDSPSFTGVPTAPTPVLGDDSSQIATTAFVASAISGGGGGGETLLRIIDYRLRTTSTWTRPSDTKKIIIEMVGGGGGGGRSSRTGGGAGGAGGGGGGYIKVFLDLDAAGIPPGSVINFYIGLGGAGATETGPGSRGENSWFGNSSYITVDGGGGGGGVFFTSSLPNGGSTSFQFAQAPGLPHVSSIGKKGGTPMMGFYDPVLGQYYIVGGNGGDSALCPGGGVANGSGDGVNGVDGTGGGGSGGSGSNRSGGRGGNGTIIIYHYG